MTMNGHSVIPVIYSLILPKEVKKHVKHEILCNVTNKMIKNASRFLKPNENNKLHALSFHVFSLS